MSGCLKSPFPVRECRYIRNVNYLLSPPSIAAFVAAAVALVVVVMSLRRRAFSGAAEFSLMMCSVFIWALTSALASAAVRPGTKTFFAVMGYIGSANVAPLFLLFALRYRKHSWRPSWWHLAALWLIPAITLGLAATNSFHGLVWSSITPGPPGSNELVYRHGPWFYVAVGYYAMLGVAAAIIIGRAAWRAQRMFISQTLVLLAGLLIPWVFSAIYILPNGPFPGLDLPPLGFAITGILVMAGMRRFHLLDIVPVARHFLVESMADAVMVLDAQDRIVDVNPTARALIGQSKEVIGRRVDEVPDPLGGALSRLLAGVVDHVEVSLEGRPVRYVDIHLSPLLDRDGSTSGRVLVIHDLSERRRMELEREKLITDLQAALGDIRTLRGLLPICASCKKIRDDEGSWKGLEKYIMEHSDAQFSHGICPDCMQRLYPDTAK
jgi:PAS domain S-box-containing protein